MIRCQITNFCSRVIGSSQRDVTLAVVVHSELQKSKSARVWSWGSVSEAVRVCSGRRWIIVFILCYGLAVAAPDGRSQLISTAARDSRKLSWYHGSTWGKRCARQIAPGAYP